MAAQPTSRANPSQDHPGLRTPDSPVDSSSDAEFAGKRRSARARPVFFVTGCSDPRSARRNLNAVSSAEPRFAPPPPVTPRGNVHHVGTLGTLMVVQGTLVLLWFLFCVFGVAVGAINMFLDPRLQYEGWMLIGLYGAFGLGALAAGTLGIVAGLRVRKRRSRTLGIVALAVGWGSVVCGNVFCAPTAMALCIFGLIVLLDADVKRAFEANLS